MTLSSPFPICNLYDMQLNSRSSLNISERGSREIMKAFNHFHHNDGIFPSNYSLSSKPDKQTANYYQFTIDQSKNIVSLFVILLRVTKSHGLVCTQFLCVLNIYLGSNRQISKDAITECYHNLLMHPLNQTSK